MNRMKPPVISIVSKKRSGKTTLLERIIPELKQRGYRVGTVKHDTHGFEIDHEGKDTWRHKQAGAEVVVISSPWKISVIKDVAEEVGLEEIVASQLSEMDIVLTEGFKRSGMPQVEVFLSTAHQHPMHDRTNPGTLVAVMSDVPLDLGVPRFHIDDIPALADFIETRFIRPASNGL